MATTLIGVVADPSSLIANVSIVFSIASPLLVFAAAWGGIKVGMNGLRDDVKEIKHDVKVLGETDARHGERIARLEVWPRSRRD